MKMKKLIVSTLILGCVMPLVACDSTKARSNLVLTAENFYSNQDIEEICCSPEIDTRKQNENYYSIKYYEELINLSLALPEKYYSTFSNIPLNNTNNAGSLCTQATKKLELFEEKYEQFQSDYDDFTLETTDHYDDNVGLHKLKTIKEKYAELVYSANNFNQAFVSAYTTLYASDTSTQAVILNATISTYATLIDNYITYSLKEYNGLHPNILTSTYLDELSNLKTCILTKNINSTNYENWKEYKLTFDNEVKNFQTSLNKVDLPNDLSVEEEDRDESTQLYIENINTFVDTNAPLFMQKTQTLFN